MLKKFSNSQPESKSGKSSSTKNKDCEAIFELTKRLFTEDPITSLRYILQVKSATKMFTTFLRTENSEAQLDIYLEVKSLDNMSNNDTVDAIIKIYRMYKGSNVSESKSRDTNDEIYAMRNWVHQEAERSLRMLAKNAFPRFLQSQSRQLLDSIQDYGNITNFEQTLLKNPRDWLRVLVSLCECMPASITIADMRIPGMPLVHVNQEFCRVTGYSKDEVLGHNCRFLQGPKTEADSVFVMRDALSKGQDCHVKLTNYRKNGDMFKNTLSLRVVYDSKNSIRYVIGLQFELPMDAAEVNIKQCILLLDTLLCLIPSVVSDS